MNELLKFLDDKKIIITPSMFESLINSKNGHYQGIYTRKGFNGYKISVDLHLFKEK